MSKFFLLLPALFLTLSTQLFAADEEIQKTKTDTALVSKALAQVHYLKGQPDSNAKYYIYLHSAGWCGPCRKEMPHIVDLYKKFKELGFEIILFGHDGTDGEVLAFAERYNAEFPVLRDVPELASQVPGYKKITRVPRIIVVDRSGKEIVETHPVRFFYNDQWKSYLPKEETGAGQASPDAPAETK